MLFKWTLNTDSCEKHDKCIKKINEIGEHAHAKHCKWMAYVLEIQSLH